MYTLICLIAGVMQRMGDPTELALRVFTEKVGQKVVSFASASVSLLGMHLPHFAMQLFAKQHLVPSTHAMLN